MDKTVRFLGIAALALASCAVARSDARSNDKVAVRRSVPAVYPSELAGARATVVVALKLKRDGAVRSASLRSARVVLEVAGAAHPDVSGPIQAFTDAAISAARQWTFEPNGPRPAPVEIEFEFRDGKVRTICRPVLEKPLQLEPRG